MEQSRYGEEFQISLLHHAISDPVFFEKVAKYVQEDFFITEPLRWTLKQLQLFARDMRRRPNYPELYQRARLFTPEKQQVYTETIKRIAAEPLIGMDFVRKELTGFVRLALFVSLHNEQKRKFDSAINLGGSLEDVYTWSEDAVKRLSEVNFEDERTIDFDDLDHLLEMAEKQVTRAIPSGIIALDRCMAGLDPFQHTIHPGGFLPQTLGVFLGSTNDGKSNALINVAYHALKARKKVLFMSHEDGEMILFLKILSRFTQIPVNKLKFFHSLTESEKDTVHRMKEYLKAHLDVKFIFGEQCTIENIGSIVRTRKRETDFDIFIDDYGQKIRSKRGFEQLRFLHEYVYSEFKMLALELDISAVTVAQGNRNAKIMARAGESWLRVQDIAECYGIGMVSDYVISLNISDELRSLNKLVFFIDKNKHGEKEIAVKCDTDYKCITTHWDTPEKQIILRSSDQAVYQAQRVIPVSATPHIVTPPKESILDRIREMDSLYDKPVSPVNGTVS